VHCIASLQSYSLTVLAVSLWAAITVHSAVCMRRWSSTASAAATLRGSLLLTPLLRTRGKGNVREGEGQGKATLLSLAVACALSRGRRPSSSSELAALQCRPNHSKHRSCCGTALPNLRRCLLGTHALGAVGCCLLIVSRAVPDFGCERRQHQDTTRESFFLDWTLRRERRQRSDVLALGTRLRCPSATPLHVRSA